MNYKINDKVRIINGSSNTIMSYNNRVCRIISLTGSDNEVGLLTVDIPHNPPPKNNLYVRYENIERFYIKPLKELYHKLGKMNNDSVPGSLKDFGIICVFINQKNTLTNEELKQCALIWEKYNK